MFQVINRCFQIMQTHTEQGWRLESDLVITPAVNGIADAFGSGPALIQAGETAAPAALPIIEKWLGRQTAELPALNVRNVAPAALTAVPQPPSPIPEN